MTKKIYIFGEIHNNISSVEYIKNQIIRIKPEYILHELLYEDTCLDKETIQSRLDNNGINELCDPRINKDIYEIGLRLNCKLIGIAKEVNANSIQKQFKLREQHMIYIIKQYVSEYIMVVLGDTHLRSNNTILGSNYLYQYLASLNNIIVKRVPKKLREIF